MKKKETVEIPERVLEFSNEKGLFDCGIIVVGLSGGPDSVALLHILKELQNCSRISCDIYAFHCNHHLRPVVCDEEAEMVRGLCAENHVELEMRDFDCRAFAEKNHISEETAGRVLRYEAFEQFARTLEKMTGKTVRIAIAHHKDDISETMMMNLFRGSGLEGLVNPRPVAGRVIRPLLCLNKHELVGYLDALGVRYATDQTNLSTDGTRNTWRNVFLPKIGSYYNEDPSVPLTRTYKLLSDDLDYISDASEKAYISSRKEIHGYPVLSVSKIKNLHPAIRSRLIRSLWLETFDDLVDFEEIHLKDCFSLIEEEPSGQMLLDMPFGRKAFRHEDNFAFADENTVPGIAAGIAGEMGFLTAEGALNVEINLKECRKDSDLIVKIPNSAIKLKIRVIENAHELEYNNLSWFCPENAFAEDKIIIGNCSGIREPLRFRRAGSSGGKDLNRLMTDLKIPETARKQILFFERDGDVLWLPGYGHGVGFTNAVSHDKYIASRPEGYEAESMIRIAVERQ